MRGLVLGVLVLVVGCRISPTFTCSLDAQCAGGVCRNNGCAFAAAECSSGYRWDSSSPLHARACVPLEPTAPDLAFQAPADLAALPPDLVVVSTDMAMVPPTCMAVMNDAGMTVYQYGDMFFTSPTCH